MALFVIFGLLVLCFLGFLSYKCLRKIKNLNKILGETIKLGKAEADLQTLRYKTLQDQIFTLSIINSILLYGSVPLTKKAAYEVSTMSIEELKSMTDTNGTLDLKKLFDKALVSSLVDLQQKISVEISTLSSEDDRRIKGEQIISEINNVQNLLGTIDQNSSEEQRNLIMQEVQACFIKIVSENNNFIDPTDLF
jgi:hypothetical protein